MSHPLRGELHFIYVRVNGGREEKRNTFSQKLGSFFCPPSRERYLNFGRAGTCAAISSLAPREKHNFRGNAERAFTIDVRRLFCFAPSRRLLRKSRALLRNRDVRDRTAESVDDVDGFRRYHLSTAFTLTSPGTEDGDSRVKVSRRRTKKREGGSKRGAKRERFHARDGDEKLGAEGGKKERESRLSMPNRHFPAGRTVRIQTYRDRN